MDREKFKNRLKQYKQAREENPGLKYWEWKNIPKYDEGTDGVRDNTYVAPIEKEQVFIPATGSTKLLQDIRNKITRNGQIKSGAIDIVSPEFDLLTLGRSIGNAIYKNLPTDMVYRRTTQSEIDDIIESGVFRKLPEGKVAGKGKTFTINGKTVTLHKKGGNAHGGKAFSKGEPWRGTTVTGTADETIVGIPGKGTQWKVGHHGDYSDYTPFENIEKGKGLWEPFNENGIVENVSPKGMRVFRPFTYGYKEDGLLPITGLNLIGENVYRYADGGEVGKNDFMKQFGKQVSYKPEETSWWSDVKNWWNDLTGMKNYAYGNCATTPSGKHTKECAHYSNSVLRNRGYKNIVGDAWTRAANSGMKKITSGYDGLTKPVEWDESDAHDYLQSAANNFINNVDTTALNPYDVIGLYYPDSPNTKKAFEQGRWGETQTHTGHIAVGNDGTHYVVHNVGGHLKMNKLADMLTGDYDYLPVSAYRPKK